MLHSIALIFLFGIISAFVIEKLHLPRIIGMLIAGIIMGPFGFNLFDPIFLSHSSDFRQMALIIILIKAGLTVNLTDLKKVGRPAILMSFLPATFEIIAYLLLMPLMFDLSIIDAALLGSVMAAVSPAVVVPRMVRLIEKEYGTEEGVPQLVLAGASFDDIVVIVLFTSFMTMSQGQTFQLNSFLDIPFAVTTGIILGILTGGVVLILRYLLKLTPIQETLIILSLAFLLIHIEQLIQPYLAMSGLLATISMASIVKLKTYSNDVKTIAEHYSQLWIGAELILFVLVGSAVDVSYLFEAGVKAIFIILITLFIRSIAVYLCLLGTHLTQKERLFCVISYLPKATVQAAIGAVPLSAGLESGPLILSFAVLGIVITAPIGALLIDYCYPYLLRKRSE